MTVKAGNEFSVEYIKEGTFGTTPTNPDFVWPGIAKTCSFTVDPKLQQHAGFKAIGATDGRALDQAKNGTYDISGSLEIEAQPTSFAALMEFGFGASGAVAQTLPSMSLYKKERTTPLHEVALGTKFNSMTISSNIDEAVMVSANLFIKNISDSEPTLGTGSHATAEDAKPLKFSDCYLTKGAGEKKISSFSLVVDNKLERIYRMTATNPELVSELKENSYREIRLEFTADYTQDELTEVTAETETTFVLNVGNTAITLPDCVAMTYPSSTSYDDLIEVPMSYLCTNHDSFSIA